MQQQWLDILYSYVEKEYLVIRILYDWNRDNGIYRDVSPWTESKDNIHSKKLGLVLGLV